MSWRIPDPTPREVTPTTELPKLLVEGTGGYVLVSGTGMRYVGKFLDNYGKYALNYSNVGESNGCTLIP